MRARGEGVEVSLALFEKKCPDFRKKYPNCVHLLGFMSHLKCSFKNPGVKNPKFFPKIFIEVPPFNGTSPVLKNSCFTFA